MRKKISSPSELFPPSPPFSPPSSMKAEEIHLSVMPEETLALLAPRPGDVVVDGTVGMGGHAARLAAAVGPTGRVIGLDQDPEALTLARERLAGAPCPVTLVRANFSTLLATVRGLGIKRADRVLLDLGVSSLQVDDAARGFSFLRDGPLDMRMDPSRPLTAAAWVAEADVDAMAAAFRELADEPHARRIAKSIAAARAKGPITTTGELSAVVAAAVPGRGRNHPATRVFQALRMVVNDEMGALRRGLSDAAALLAPGGRLAVIAFHSTEDRLVKRAFRAWHDEGRVDLVRRRAVKPGRDEILRNRRARSAVLRVIKKKV